MEKYKVGVGIRYLDQRIDVHAVCTGQSQDASLQWYMRAPNGALVAFGSLSKQESYKNLTTYYGGTSFGNSMFGLGVDDRGLTGGKIRYAEPFTNWSPGTATSNSLMRSIETGTIPINTFVSRGDDVYSNMPAFIYRGDSVFNAIITEVSGKNYIKYSNPTGPSTTAANFTGAIIEVLSGAHIGQTAFITQPDTQASGFYIDRDFTQYSGELIKIMPKRIITNYSGWEEPIGVGSQGTGGIQAMFTLDGSLTRGLGSWAPGVNAIREGESLIDLGPLLVGTPGFGLLSVTGTKVSFNKDPYMREMAVGDVIEYNDTFAQTFSGLVIEVGQHSATRDYVIFWPYNTSYAFTNILYRCNYFFIENFPRFDEQYEVFVHDGIQLLGHTSVQTPSAFLDFSANEFDSTYGTVGELAHFHIGPIRLSNGECITVNNHNLFLSGEISNGDVTAPTILARKTLYATYDNSVGQNFSGTYYRDGVFTMTYPGSFNASETLSCKIHAHYGAADITSVITLPVQPAI